MPSDLIVEATKIDNIIPHPNADRMEIAIVKGWQVCVQKDVFKKGQVVIYIPPDSLLPEELANSWGVKNYLASKNRVKAIRLRGEISFGFIIENKDNFKSGDDVKEFYGIKKWNPPIPMKRRIRAGGAFEDHVNFFKYTRIQNFRNFPEMFEEGDEIWISEKIHGMNARVGIVPLYLNLPSSLKDKIVRWIKHKLLRQPEFKYVLGSHNVQKKIGKGSIFEIGLAPCKPLLEYLWNLNIETRWPPPKSVIIYFEVFGDKIQDLTYGRTNDEVDFRIFDISIDGIYLPYSHLKNFCEKFSIPMVPVLYEGEFNRDLAFGLSKGDTTLMDKNPHMREGIVIKSLGEDGHDEKPGRKILKIINDDYLLRSGGTEYT